MHAPAATSGLPTGPHTLPAPSPLSLHWKLDPGLVYLNHGSFGATPRLVLEAQSAWQERMERDLVRWFVEEHHHAVDQARMALGDFLRCPWEALAPVTNATVGVATVFANEVLQGRLGPGDGVLISSHEYPACQNNARWWAARAGAEVRVAALPFPVASEERVVRAIEQALTPSTRLALLSHVASSSGLVLPLERIVPMLHARGVRTLIDGAHAIGMLPGLDLGALRPSYYTANCHKWLCSPKGSAFLYVDESLREGFRPLALSNNAEQPRPGREQFLTEFEYVGTSDMTAFYAIPDAIRVMRAMLPGGWPAIARANHDLTIRGRDVLCERLGIVPQCPDAMLGSICTLPLPPHGPGLMQRLRQRSTKYHDALWDVLLERWKIQVPIWSIAGTEIRTVRISAQLYNSIAQYEYLGEALAAELDAERRLA